VKRGTRDSLLVRGTVVITSAPDRYQSIMDIGKQSGATSCHAVLQERTATENELSRVVTALLGLGWTALSDGYIDLPK
jgi:hypothetical protein